MRQLRRPGGRARGQVVELACRRALTGLCTDPEIARPRTVGGRADLRLATPLQAAARPLRPPPRDPRSLPRDRLLPRLLQDTPTVIVIEFLQLAAAADDEVDLRVRRQHPAGAAALRDDEPLL